MLMQISVSRPLWHPSHTFLLSFFACKSDWHPHTIRTNGQM
ncbi:hypothetical protein M153_30240001616 [Pseudoloma neurophilia]|uniref:Uncharacterized protein n=1 Tax=Pseudoloma neurophilia TaxID=146866 RepID=A0A0R0M2Z7_9MICR|nr:hypothetical protein M153_30240001616 [Pseudoloma neurophilia]